MDFINNLPHSMIEELELQQTPDMQRELKIKMKKFLDMESIERPENEDGYSKASKANYDQKEHITQKDEATPNGAHQPTKMYSLLNSHEEASSSCLLTAKRSCTSGTSTNCNICCGQWGKIVQ